MTYNRVLNKSNTIGATSGADHTTNNLQLQEIGNAINYISTHLNKKIKRDITVFIHVGRYQNEGAKHQKRSKRY
jgi:hypothetical protein